MTDQSIAEIIEGCKAGNEACFSQLVDIYSRRLYGFFCRMTGNRNISDDLLSELFVKLVRKISTFRGDNFDNWLFTIASNVFRDYLKQKQRQKKLIESSIKQLEHYSEGKDPDFELTDKLQAELNNLDEETREILVMRFYSDMSFKEISEIRSEPIGTTLSKLHRGLKKLRNSFEINL